jgi:hypothetical protein
MQGEDDMGTTIANEKRASEREKMAAHLRADLETRTTEAVAALTAKITAARAESAAAAKKVEADLAETYTTLAKRLCADLHDHLAKPVRTYLDQPCRDAAKAIAGIWTTFDARCVLELGAPLGAHHLAVAFGRAICSQGALASALSDELYSASLNPADMAAHKAATALHGNVPGVVDALAALEKGLLALVSRPPVAPGSTREVYFAMKAATATARDLHSVREALLAEERRASR